MEQTGYAAATAVHGSLLHSRERPIRNARRDYLGKNAAKSPDRSLQGRRSAAKTACCMERATS